MKGVPVRIELGPRDIEAGNCVLVSRVTGEKTVVSLENIGETVKAALENAHKDMFEKALENRKNRTYTAKDLDELVKIAEEKSGYIKAMWCEELECEMKLKELADVTSRCMPIEQEQLSDRCVCCGKPAKKLVYWGKAY
jgi:prolyl-tRNA synthetase